MKTPRKKSGRDSRPRDLTSGPPPSGDRAAARRGGESSPRALRDETPRWRVWSLQVTLVAGAAALLYLGLASWSDPGQVADVIRRFPPPTGVLVGGLVLLGLALRAARWHYYVRTLAIAVPAVASVLAFVAGFAFTATPGKVGEVVKSFLLRRRFGARVSETAAVLVVERLTDLLAVLVLAGVALDRGLGVALEQPAASSAVEGVGPEVSAAVGAWAGEGWVLGASALLLAAALAFLLSARLQETVLAGLGRVPGLGRVTRSLPALLGSSRRLLTPARLTVGLALALAAWSCEALALHAILRALGAGVPPSGAFFAFAAASLLGVLSMLPGGLGGFEATMVVLLGRLAVPPSTAVAATLLFRLGTLWLVSLLGLVVLGGWMAVYGRDAGRPRAGAGNAGSGSGSR